MVGAFGPDAPEGNSVNLKQLTFALVSAGTMLAGTASAASAAPATSASSAVRTAGSDVHVQSVSRQYKNVKSGMCLDTKTKAGNQAVRKVACHPKGHKDIKHQLWIADNDGTFHSLISPKNCLSLRGNTNEVISQKCGTTKKQVWTWSGNTTGRLKNKAKGKCLTLNHDNWLMVGACTGKNSQWKKY